jgi:hypothetical protein
LYIQINSLNMKKALLLLLFLNLLYSQAQVGIGTTIPSGMLDITSTTNGVLIPRVALTAKNVAAPVVNPQGGALANSTLVYNILTSGTSPNNVVPGFYYWETATLSWKPLVTTSNNWSLTGNAGTNATTNFLGTTDDRDLVFRRFNTRAGLINTTNTSFGLNALNTASTGTNNIAVGLEPLKNNSTGGYNVAIGWRAMELNQSGSFNTVVGNASLMKNTDGFSNAAFGDLVLRENINGVQNVGFGTNALIANLSGSQNSAFGVGSLSGNTSGIFNTGIGYFALSSLQSGENNLAIGSNAQVPDANGSNQLSIANAIYGIDTGNSFTTTTLAKIGINEPSPSAKLHISPSNTFAPNSTDGILIPRVNNFPSTNPTAAQNGMLIYLIAQFGGNIAGFYYWENATSSWKCLNDTKLPYKTTGASTGIYQILMTDYTVRVFNSVTVVNLPNASGCLGKVFVIIGSNGISSKTLSSLGGVIYDDVTNANIISIAANQRYMVQSDGTDWIVIGR